MTGRRGLGRGGVGQRPYFRLGGRQRYTAVLVMVVLHDVVVVHLHVVHLVGVVKVLEHRFAVVVSVRHNALPAHHVISVAI